ncbi:hypothetical protein GCM10028818_09950 [Spirosoma horti]
MAIMARLVPGRSSKIWWLAGALVACQPSSETPVYIDANKCSIQVSEGITSIQGNPVSGIIFTTDTQGDTLFTVPFRNGKENGLAHFFYPGKRRQAERLYVNGWKEGTHQGWYPNGRLQFEYHFHNDLFEGSYREWFPNGKLFRNMHYEKGEESGVQQSWYTTGKVKTNYIIKDNRRYGLLGTKHCKNVADSILRK